jgi:hypothetical protein
MAGITLSVWTLLAALLLVLPTAERAASEEAASLSVASLARGSR